MLTEVGGACATGDGEVSVFYFVILPLVLRYISLLILLLLSLLISPLTLG